MPGETEPVKSGKTAEQLDTDVYTLQDMIEAISQPLRDYREQFDGPMLRHDVLTLEDLHPGDELEGVVRNVVDFGAFVDIGLHEMAWSMFPRWCRAGSPTPAKLYQSATSLRSGFTGSMLNVTGFS